MNSFDKIYNHLAKTLPENLNARRDLLKALHNVLTDDHALKPVVASQIAAIDSVISLQADFVFVAEGLK
jgi:hypothetical protein